MKLKGSYWPVGIFFTVLILLGGSFGGVFLQDNACVNCFTPMTPEQEAILFGGDNKNFEYISPETVKAMTENGDDLFIIDARSKKAYNTERVPESISIEFKKIEDEIEKLIDDKSTTLIVYSTSARQSAMAAKKIGEMGYSNLFNMGSFDDWSFETQGGEVFE